MKAESLECIAVDNDDQKASEGGDLCQLSDFFLWKIKHLRQDGEEHIKAAVSLVVMLPYSVHLLWSGDVRRGQTHVDAYVNGTSQIHFARLKDVVTDLENKAHLSYVQELCNVKLNDMLVEKSYTQVLL